MPNTFYLFGEDLAAGLVGPFETREAAERHLKFQTVRGDASSSNGTAKILTEEEAQVHWAWENNLCTPERDIKIWELMPVPEAPYMDRARAVSLMFAAHPEHLDIIEEYADEAEHQDGDGYWNNFGTDEEVLTDFRLYLKNVLAP